MNSVLDCFYDGIFQARKFTEKRIVICVAGKASFDELMAEIRTRFPDWRTMTNFTRTDAIEIYGVRVYRSPNLEEGFFFGEESERI